MGYSCTERLDIGIFHFYVVEIADEEIGFRRRGAHSPRDWFCGNGGGNGLDKREWFELSMEHTPANVPLRYLADNWSVSVLQIQWEMP